MLDCHLMIQNVPFASRKVSRNTANHLAFSLQVKTLRRETMPVILWLLGVPLSVIVIAALFGAF